MRPFRTKAKIKLFVLGLIIIGMITVAGNVSLAVNKNTVENEINGFFHHDIAIGPVFYIFPDTIILRDVLIAAPKIFSKDRSFTLSRITMRFSFWELLSRGRLHVSKVTLSSSRVNVYALSSFLQDNFQEILEIIRNSPGNDITVRINETLVDFDRRGQPDYIAVQLRLKIEDEMMRGVGFFRADQYDFTGLSDGQEARRVAQGWPLWYKLESRLRPDGVDVAQLILKSGAMHAKLWGHIRSDRIKVNGFAFLNAAKDVMTAGDYSSTRYFRHFPEGEDLDLVDTYVLDIDGRVALAYPDVSVERFNFTVNDLPVSFKGALSLKSPFSFTADLAADASKTDTDNGIFFQELEAHAGGSFEDQSLRSDGGVRIVFRAQDGAGLTLEKGEAALKDMVFYWDRQKRLRVDVDKTQVLYWTNANGHKVTVEDAKVVGHLRREGPKRIEVAAPFYGGTLDGYMRIDDAKMPWTFTSLFQLDHVESAALEELLVHFAKFNGRLSSELRLTNIPRLTLNGELVLTDGTMTDVAFFNWLADTFRLLDLKAIGFDRASAQFTLDRDHLLLRDIHLKTDDVRISGYFEVDRQDLVTSKLSLGLSQGLLGRSPKFRPVLRLFENDEPLLGFEFQLSGNIDAMNFQWLSNEVKRKIQGRIPDFVERLIERDVDEMMGP